MPDWSAFLQEQGLFIGKMVLAAVLGGLFGLEREWGGREAGLRTNMMIAIASCLFTHLGLEAFPTGDNLIRDPARIAAQIVSGVGFLGAGALLQHKNKVRGLTTAATIWLVAAVGMAIGAGAYFTAIFTSIIALAALIFLRPLSMYLERRARTRLELRKAARQVRITAQKVNDGEEDDWLDEDQDW